MPIHMPEIRVRRSPARSSSRPSEARLRSLRSLAGGVTGGLSLLLAAVASPAAAFVPAPAETPRDVMQNRTLEGIYDRVELALLHDAEGALEGSEVEVRVAPGGVVILQGAVPSEAARREALELARRQVGVSEVRDALVIDPALRPEPGPASMLGHVDTPSAEASADPDPDARLAAEIAQRLARALGASEPAAIDGEPATWRVETNEGAFEVAARAGHVRLAGEVESPEEVARLARRFEASPWVRSLEVDVEEVDEGGFFDFLGF